MTDAEFSYVQPLMSRWDNYVMQLGLQHTLHQVKDRLSGTLSLLCFYPFLFLFSLLSYLFFPGEQSL